jgi:hypothetical protein
LHNQKNQLSIRRKKRKVKKDFVIHNEAGLAENGTAFATA